jgi:glycosyltransferase involved in cell wall biosynthesis
MDPSERPDVVYVVNLDYCMVALAALGSPFGRTPFAGMLMNLNFHHRAMGVGGRRSWRERLNEVLVRRLLALPGLVSLMTLDELFPRYAEARSIAGKEKICYVPELPTLDDCASNGRTRKDFGLRDEQCAVLVYGSLSLRKGIAQLLRATAGPSCPPSVVVVLAGVQDDAVRALLKGDDGQALRASGRLIEVPGYLSPSDEAAVFRAANVAWLGYWNFYNMSGMLLQATIAGLPVIACKNGLVGWYSSTYGLGELVDVTQHDEIVRALQSLALDRGKHAAFSKNCRTFAARYTVEKFEDAICGGLSGSRRPLGLQDSPRTQRRQAPHSGRV